VSVSYTALCALVSLALAALATVIVCLGLLVTLGSLRREDFDRRRRG
jgi:energy-converting hydrogenase Eha subunit C